MLPANRWLVRLATAACLSACTSDLPTDLANLECDYEQDPPCVRGYLCLAGLCVHPSQLTDGGASERDAAPSPSAVSSPRTSELAGAAPSSSSSPAARDVNPIESSKPNAHGAASHEANDGASEIQTSGSNSTADGEPDNTATGDSDNSADGDSDNSADGDSDNSVTADSVNSATSTGSNPAGGDGLESTASNSTPDPATEPSYDAGVSAPGPGFGVDAGTSDSEATSEAAPGDADAGATDDPTTDAPESCSETCVAPPRGSAACVDGVCRVTCNDDLELCDLECVNLENDRQHCGACGKECILACIASICLL